MNWRDKYIDSHRCEKLLKNHGVCIRKFQKQDITSWILFSIEYDPERGIWYLSNICQAEYCPFCGEKLD